jgi:hypothetical protein
VHEALLRGPEPARLRVTPAAAEPSVGFGAVQRQRECVWPLDLDGARTLATSCGAPRRHAPQRPEQIKDEFDPWRTRDVSEVAIDYLFVDASHFKMHDGARSEPVLIAYGITTEGNLVLLHLEGVSAESTDACVAFLEGMVARGLGSPVLTATDGAPGLCAAIDQVFPLARRQRCLIHRSRNCLSKVSEVDPVAVRGGRGTSSCTAVRSDLGQDVSGRGRDSHRRARRTRRAPVLPAGALAKDPAHQRDRAHLRREGAPRTRPPRRCRRRRLTSPTGTAPGVAVTPAAGRFSGSLVRGCRAGGCVVLVAAARAVGCGRSFRTGRSLWPGRRVCRGSPSRGL